MKEKVKGNMVERHESSRLLNCLSESKSIRCVDLSMLERCRLLKTLSELKSNWFTEHTRKTCLE